MQDPHAHQGTLLAIPKDGMDTLTVAYFFSGPKRKASICQCLMKLCMHEGAGLKVYEIDICIGGSDHDLLDQEAQEAWLTRIGAADFAVGHIHGDCRTSCVPSSDAQTRAANSSTSHSEPSS